jgi:DNA-binding response OmpR family regulator
MAKILVVEDDVLVARVVQNSLEEAKYEVTVVGDANAAYKALEDETFDLVYLDILLPGGEDGFVILARIKSNKETTKTPVVMLTNLGQQEDIDRAMQLGASDYVVKANIDPDRLVEIAKKYLGN